MSEIGPRAVEDSGAHTSAVRATRVGRAPSLAGVRALRGGLAPVADPEPGHQANTERADTERRVDALSRGGLPGHPANTERADTLPEAARPTGPHNTIIASRVGGVLGHLAPVSGPAERARLRLVPGKLIPGTRYRLIKWLGEGGMGVVYEAEHVDIDRHVALKILRSELSQQPEMAQVFRDEARAASRMGHANVVEIFDFGELPDGRLWLCMELLAGRDLVPAPDEPPRAPGELIGILRQLCKGLAAAHAAGIVHRDIKPENVILVERGGREGVVKLVDFGISAMMAAEPASARIAGTPHYMAPEQIQGQPFDGRLDMYAVGCVAYELLTGTPPFPGEVVEEVLLAQIDDEPVPPSRLRPELKLPPPLEAVILRCLAKRPADRYADMNDLEAALCEAQVAAGLTTAWDDLPLPAVDPERVARLRRAMPDPSIGKRRRWLAPAAAAAVALLAGVGLTVALLPGPPSDHARDAVDELAEQALAAASLTHYVAPPPDQQDAPTAYQKVLALEALTGDAERLADERAAELRHRLAAGLVSLGDKYWDVGGARPFAVEYYIWARTFEPDNRRAVERSGLTHGAFAQFQDKAASGGWSLGELQSLGLVGALADDDPQRRQAGAMQALAGAELSLRERRAVEVGLRGLGVEPTSPAAPSESPPVTPSEPAVLAAMPDSGAPTPVKHGRPPALAKVKRDPARAKQLAEEGAAALRAGRRQDAENLFHQAIAYDNRNVKALMGLSDVYFDTGAKQKSVQFAELAVEAAPQSKACHIKLGDAYYNVLRYRDALEHYEKARDFGEASAQGRIDKVKSRIGG